MESDWDLYAVVRGCTTATSTTTATTAAKTTSTTTTTPSSAYFSIYPAEQSGQVLSISNPYESRSSVGELHELCKPFFLKSQPLSSNSFSYSSPSPKSTGQTKLQQLNKQPQHSGSATTPRSKRRKIQHKKVCEVQAENLSSDIWAWRKYGQKPIKGSPYPRGYYRCSSSKGCLARKQVERNKTDPTMFIVTYTGEHSHPAPTHRNSLAGSTRQKPSSPQAVTAEDSSQPFTKQVSPSTSEAEEEEATPSKSESREDLEDLMNDDEENEFELSDMVVTDDFFEGLDELTGFAGKTVASSGGDCFGDPFAANIALPACGGQ